MKILRIVQKTLHKIPRWLWILAVTITLIWITLSIIERQTPEQTITRLAIWLTASVVYTFVEIAISLIDRFKRK